mmetsp:Transcript_22436/g.34709  ORF Transcript_22436/g.34709 Transcript_22436/m.34709 type:complete len:126 (-) Transcript_22436:245-622(-)
MRKPASHRDFSTHDLAPRVVNFLLFLFFFGLVGLDYLFWRISWSTTLGGCRFRLCCGLIFSGRFLGLIILLLSGSLLASARRSVGLKSVDFDPYVGVLGLQTGALIVTSASPEERPKHLLEFIEV